MKTTIIKPTNTKKKNAKVKKSFSVPKSSKILPGRYSQVGYKSARVPGAEGRTPSNSTGSQHQLYDRKRLIAQSREFMRDNSIYYSMIEKSTAYIIGDGYTLQAQTRSDSWNRKAEAQYKNFMMNPDIKGILTGASFERMVCKEQLTAGDVGVLKTNEGKLQIFEAEQINDSEYKDGIKKDNFGKPLTYYVEGYTSNGNLNRKSVPLSPNDFLLISDPDRPSSVRSTPCGQSSFSNLHRISDILDAEAIAWQLLSRMALSINRKDAAAKALDISGDDDQANSTGNDAEISERITETSYATIFHGEVGEEISSIDRNLPGKDFPQSIKMFLRLLGLPLGLPLELILIDYSDTNYSSSRALLEQAFVNFKRRQNLLEYKYHRPVYEWFINNQIAKGELAERKDKFKHSWIKPTFPWIDQLKEAQAWGSKLDRSLTTQGKAIKSLGDDPDEILDLREKEINNAIERANRINEANKDVVGFIPVDWRVFAGFKAETSQGKPMGIESAPATPKDI